MAHGQDTKVTDNSQGTGSSAQANIETVARMENDFLGQRSLTDRIGDGIADFAGTMTFFLLHVAWFIAWVILNAGKLPGIQPFDPYPYVFLTMAVSMEGVLLATFVLMKQNRMSRRADQRNHLNLQIDLLAEKEITKILQLQQMVCDHMGLKSAGRDAEVQELSQVTAVDQLAQELKEKLPGV